MYEELIARLQDFAAGTEREEDAELAFDAINALSVAEHREWAAQNEIAGLQSVLPYWISVKDGLPENDCRIEVRKEFNFECCSVLAYDENGGIYPRNRYQVLKTGIDYLDQNPDCCQGWLWSCGADVTHWMPLPAPPREDE